MADELPNQNLDAATPTDDGTSPASPSASDLYAQEVLKAAQDAIAGLGDITNDLNSAGANAASAMNSMSMGSGDPNDAIAEAMAQAMLESGAAASASARGTHAVGPGAAHVTNADMGNSGNRFELPAFDVSLSPAQQRAISLLSDVNLNVKIELGRTRMLVEDVLKLSEGAVIELDKLAGDPVDVYVNDRHVARGEVLVLNDNFCVRINEIITPVDGKNGVKEGSPAA